MRQLGRSPLGLWPRRKLPASAPPELALPHRDVPALSVVMPVYNVAPFLESALISVLYQEFRDFELIIVDDASTDASSVIIHKYARLDSRIRVVSLRHNTLGGAGIPSNIGIREARGTYLGFADSDDIVTRGGFAHLVSLAEQHGAEVVIGGFMSFTDTTHQLVPAYDLPRSKSIPRSTVISATSHPELMALSPVPWRKLYRRSFLEQFRIAYPEGDYFFEDNPLHWEVLANADRIVLTDEIVSHHRMGRDGQTMSSMQHRRAAFAHHFATALDTVLTTSGARRRALLGAYVDRLGALRWVVSEQSSPWAQAMLGKRFATLFDRAVSAGARIPFSMRRSIASYRHGYPRIDLTFVITTHQGSAVKRTIESILAVHGLNWDLIVIDDGSSGETRQLLANYEEAHENLHVISQSNRGVGRARNSALPLITGQFALFLQAGDIVDPDAVSACVSAAVAHGVDVMLFPISPFLGSVTQTDGSPLSGPSEDSYEPLSRIVAANQDQIASNKLVRSEFVQDSNIFFGGIAPFEDMQFHWQTVTQAQMIGYFPKSVVEVKERTPSLDETLVSSERDDRLEHSLWATHRAISRHSGYGSLRPTWREYAGKFSRSREAEDSGVTEEERD